MSLRNGLTIANMVLSFTLDKKLDRATLKHHYPSIKYPKSFSGGVLKYPEGCMLIFDSGKINVTGVQNECTAHSLVERFCTNYPENPKCKSSKIVNITAYFRVQDGFNYNKLLKYTGCSYDPELFPGIHLKLDNSKVIFIIFRTGRAIITGTKDLQSTNTYCDLFDERFQS